MEETEQSAKHPTIRPNAAEQLRLYARELREQAEGLDAVASVVEEMPTQAEYLLWRIFDSWISRRDY